jgi:hypothetical protein
MQVPDFPGGSTKNDQLVAPSEELVDVNPKQFEQPSSLLCPGWIDWLEHPKRPGLPFSLSHLDP